MICMEDVNKKIKGKVILEDINIIFEKGLVYGLKGINGCGKTMLMRMASGLIYPDSGSVKVNGRILGRELSFPESIGLLIENPVFLDGYTGLGNLELLASLRGEVKKEDLEEALRRVGLDPADKRKYRKYSLGMKQRLGIAASIMEKPEVLILDEPINALDTNGVELFEQILHEEKERGILILLTCHDEQKLRMYADKIVMIENGRITGIEDVQ